EVEAEVRATEEVEKVKKAVENVYRGDLVVVSDGENTFVKSVSVDMMSLEPLRKLIRVQQIGPAARSYLLRRIDDNQLTILLHKQAAFASRVSFVDDPRESPMGPIKIVVTGDDLDEVVKYLAD
ncbi:MAG: RNA-binding domain-containing protein, partial [Thermosphaera sp.]